MHQAEIGRMLKKCGNEQVKSEIKLFVNCNYITFIQGIDLTKLYIVYIQYINIGESNERNGYEILYDTMQHNILKKKCMSIVSKHNNKINLWNMSYR